MTCFGAAIIPVLNSEYSTSPQLWMWRAYNGQLYSRGNSLSEKIEKAHQGDIVRFELNCSNHELHLFLNDKEMTNFFTEVTGTIYPAVTFYGSSRAVELIDVKCLDQQPSLVLNGSKPTKLNEIKSQTVIGNILNDDVKCI